MNPMQKAAKEKSFILWIVSSVALCCAPSYASSIDVEQGKNRVEIFLGDGQNRVEPSTLSPAIASSYYDSASEAASESSVAPNTGALSGQTFSQAKTTLTTASEAYKGSTRLGHALSKHAGRNPDIWGKISGSPSTYHSQATKHLREIYRAPGDFKRVTNPNGVTFLEKMLPDGRGIRLQLDHVFKGFID
jgi:hypothetical protein